MNLVTAANLDEQSIARGGAEPRRPPNFCRQWTAIEWGVRRRGGEAP